MIQCKSIIFIVLLIFVFLLYTKSNKFIGGKKDKNDKKDKKTTSTSDELEDMIKNKNLTDTQKLELLKEEKTKHEDNVKKNTRMYNNLLTNLSSTDDEIDIAELNLEDSKNQLLLADINVSLKLTMINKKNNKNKSKDNLLDFYVKLNKVKQYNIYCIILMSNVRKIRKNTLVSPNDELFRTQLDASISETVDFAKKTYTKTNELYKISISTDNREINNFKSDLSNSRVLARELKENITLIQKRLNSKYKLDEEIKKKLSAKKEPEIDKITEDKEASLFDNLTALFKGF